MVNITTQRRIKKQTEETVRFLGYKVEEATIDWISAPKKSINMTLWIAGNEFNVKFIGGERYPVPDSNFIRRAVATVILNKDRPQ